MPCDSIVNNPCNGAKNTITIAGGVATRGGAEYNAVVIADGLRRHGNDCV